MLFQWCAGYFAVPHEPELLVGVPPPAGRLDHGSQGQVGSRDPERNQPSVTIRRRRLIGFLDYQLDGLQPLARLGIVSEPHANERRAVFFHQPFGPSLPWLENQTGFHVALLKVVALLLGRKNTTFN